MADVAAGWDEAAQGYERYFVPRFAPWVAAGVRALGDELPDGPILVPCCGTFPEIDALLAAYGDRELAGIDLSAGMLELAAARIAGRPGITVTQADAVELDPRWTGRCAAVLSVFGLQQLPDPVRAVRSWISALRPGGRLAVVFWPRVTEYDGPFARVASLLPARGAEIDLAGVALDRDDYLSFEMTHADAATFIDAYVHSGPLRALAREKGDAFVEQLRADFLRDAPVGPISHRPRARLITAS